MKNNVKLNTYKIDEKSILYLTRCIKQKKGISNNNDTEKIKELEKLNNELNLKISKLIEELNKEKEKV